jgi:hypothetical protein
MAFTLYCGVAGWFCSPWISKRPARDYEECSERVAEKKTSKNEFIASMTECDKQFVGRRKLGGGYTYYDLLQNRHFDIVGPNPTPSELKYFDEQYTLYLDVQRRDAIAAALAAKTSRGASANLSGDRPVSSASAPGLPMVIVPNGIPRARGVVVRARETCKKSPVSCGWIKLSEEMRSFFESNVRVNTP